MNNKKFILIFIFIIFMLILSGCLDFFKISNNIVIYKEHPTAASYTITYGYKINCTGQGKYSISYDLDLPEVLNGGILSTKIHENNYKIVELATYNNVIRWDFNSTNNAEYELLVTAYVKAESFIVSDLIGSNALTIKQINSHYQDIVNQFCNSQSNETTTFIDPFDPDILNTTLEIYTNAETDNSFLITKELFKWLKQNTRYKAHEQDDNEVQPAHTTFIRKTGDCDDLSFLYISMCRSLKIPSRFIKGFLVNENNIIQHVWVEVFVGGDIGNNGWIPVECAGVSNDIEAEINQNFGVENIEHLRLFLDDGSNDSLNISFSGITYKIFSDKRNIDIKFYSNVTNYLVKKTQQLIVDGNKNRYYN